MKTVTVTAVCQHATLTETWTFTVPDDYDVPAAEDDDGTLLDNLLDDALKTNTEWNMQQTSGDEQDRDITAVTVEPHFTPADTDDRD